ncbi:MAG: aldehyde dehydrogenase family protein, partial [Myxococcota bacterium]
PENFLRHAFKVEVGDATWNRLEAVFLQSHRLAAELSETPRRQQDRSAPIAPRGPVALEAFDNEPDTDFSLAANRAWARDLLARWRDRHGEAATRIPVVVAGEVIAEGREEQLRCDPSRPGVVVRRAQYATVDDVARAIRCAKEDPTGWRRRDDAQRAEILARAADALREARADLMGAALAEAGKLLTESDPEVSEAIDFVAFYAASARALRALPTISGHPKGVVAVIPPWNFPIAIPCGGVAAALATGNTVILKPAPETVMTAYLLCDAFWRAGVPKEVLQFVPTDERTGGSHLVAHPEVDVVMLTGGTETALTLSALRPEMHLVAETGGKNATVVTSMSDREQAIKHVVHSAFSHSGQKCSATSLLVLEAEVYDDPKFRETLVDAVRSLHVGSAWSLDTKLGPLVNPPSGPLERGLKELEDGERWALLPRMVDDNPALWRPGIKWGVVDGSFTHRTEFFGPVLGVMRADDLEDAIRLVNATGYGLTSGIESLDGREVEAWREGVRAGNLYINRGTTGAIVYRQPFGGMGKSAFGSGIKAGGPNYVVPLCDWRDVPPADGAPPLDRAVRCPEVEVLRKALWRELGHDGRGRGALPDADVRRVLRAIDSYDHRFTELFASEDDAFRLVGQDNLRRYRPLTRIRVRVAPEDDVFDLYARVCAAKTVGANVTVSRAPGASVPGLERLDRLTEWWGGSIAFVTETDAELAAVVAREDTERVRYAGERAPREVLAATGDTGIFIARAPVLEEGRIELLWYLREQSISHDYHRYGNLGPRAGEPRRPVT